MADAKPPPRFSADVPRTVSGMGLLDRLKSYLTVDDRTSTGSVGTRRGGYSDFRAAPGAGRAPRSEDELAVDRYRYLLRTAQPDAVEEVHAEAFAKLTPQQRRMVFEELSQNAAAADRPVSDDPRTLARSATRSELRQPGFLERTLGGGAGGMSRGPGLGTMIGGSLLGTVAGVVIGSAIADMIMPGIGDFASDFGDGAQDMASDVGDGVQDVGDGFGDFGGGDFGGGDFGGDF
jgi:hypothetical protein